MSGLEALRAETSHMGRRASCLVWGFSSGLESSIWVDRLPVGADDLLFSRLGWCFPSGLSPPVWAGAFHLGGRASRQGG